MLNFALKNIFERNKPGLRLGLGCMGMSECYGKVDDQGSIKTLRRAYELGVTHFDTANCYGQGHNEHLLGSALKDIREHITIASKCGMVRDQQTGEFIGVNGSADYIKKCCEASLKRLQTDFIDLFYLHRVDPVTPIEESVQALSELVKEGKIRHIGLSEASAKSIARAHTIYPLAAIQTEYSIWSRDPEKEVIPLCKTLNIDFVAHSPLGKSFLAGKIKNIHSLNQDDLRRALPRFQDENIEHNLSIIHYLEELAQAKRCTVAQLALAWVLAQGKNIFAIPGTKRISYLEENFKAAEIILTPSELASINTRIPIDTAKGAILPESFARFSDA